MELRGFEPLTFSLRTRRAPNCATAPFAINKLLKYISVWGFWQDGCNERLAMNSIENC